MFLSKGYINLRLVALFLTVLSSIGLVKKYVFYDRDIEIMESSEICVQPQINADSDSISFTLKSADGEIGCLLSNCGTQGWRLQSEYNGKISDYGAAQKLSYYLKEENPCKTEKITAEYSENIVTIKATDGSCAVINYSPFMLTFKNKNGGISAMVSGICVNNGNTIVRGILNCEEAMWGAGEHFDHINQRGQHIEINAVDEWAQTEGNSYMPIPILVSSRGSGLFMNRFERMTIDVDSRIVPKNTWQFSVFDAPCDLFVYTSEKPADVLYGYSLLTGFSPEPAQWTYGSVICRYYPEFSTIEGVKEMAAEMEKNDFPWEAVIVEGFDSSNEKALAEMSDAVHGMGKKLMVYSITGSSPFAAKTDETKLLITSKADGTYDLIPANSNNTEDNYEGSRWRYLDITSDSVRSYIFDDIWGNAVKEYGVDGAKVDFCELFPDTYELNMADGETMGAHHWYPVVYNTLLYNKLSENSTGAMTLSRGGSIGAQRYPWVWMGDQKREFRFLKAQLKGVISSGISGVPFTTFDMGGYKEAGKDEAQVFARAVEFTAFTGNIQTHGTVKRAYDFDDDTKAIYRKFAKIHDALRPYLVEQGKISSQTGIPLVRHLAVSYWQDKNVWNIEDEFMLGDTLLVAPILDCVNYRSIYLPEGEWTNLWTGEKYTGGRTLVMQRVDIDEIPVFVNESASSAAFEQCRDEIVGLYNGE